MNDTAPATMSMLTTAEAEQAHDVRVNDIAVDGVQTAGPVDLPTVDDPAKVAPKDARVLTKTFLDRLTELE
ncbi:RNA polymerase sigma factor SigF, partial [Streptomyces sp. NPDC003442]